MSPHQPDESDLGLLLPKHTIPNLAVGGGTGKTFLLCVRESCRQHQVSLTRSIRTLTNKEQSEKLPLFPPLRDTRVG